MRRLTNRSLLETFMNALGHDADEPCRVFFVGGATAVLMGWRDSTIDVDLRIEPETDRLQRRIPKLKDELGLNIEYASPLDFIPVRPGWQDRSPFIKAVGQASFFHFDLYAQALAKAERGHAQDLSDLEEMISRGLIEPGKALEYFESIVSDLYRYPAIDERSFRQSVQGLFRK